MQQSPEPLPVIVARLDGWLRARLSAITIWPRESGGWVAMLSYVHDIPPPAGLKDPPGAAHYPRDTVLPVDLPGDDPEPVLIEQLRQLEAQGELGRLYWTPLGHSTTTASARALQHKNRRGWWIVTHAGSRQERWEWQRSIGAPDIAA